jgi:flavodoxin I
MERVTSLQILYASTSGHTEYVIGVLQEHLKQHVPKLQIAACRAEAAKPEDLMKGDLLLLASGTWNTGGIEGQLNPHMDDLLRGRAKDVDLRGKRVAIIALGDDRYFYTCRSNEHLRRFILDHGGTLLGDALLVVNEPYGQEERVCRWADTLLLSLSQVV